MVKEGDKIAIIGGGISGMTAAYLLQRKYQVTLYEKGPVLGGHTHTVKVNDPDLGEIGIDMGFIVLNNRNYPLINRFFGELGAVIQPSEMSFGFYCDKTRFAYSGRNVNGIFANRSNLFSPKYYRFLLDLNSFCKVSLKALSENSLTMLSFGDFLKRHQISSNLIENYLIPMGSAIWSCGDQRVLNYPAQSFLSFFKNHGLLDLSDRPQWQTVVGGSASYVKIFKKKFNGAIICNAQVNKITRNGSIAVSTQNSEDSYSAVVLATHAPTTLKLLDEPSEMEQELLSAWSYAPNTVTLHTDKTFLPPNKRAWASWNYRRRTNSSELPTVTYWMNNLQSIRSRTTYCVTLNEKPSEEKIIKSVVFEHPVYTADSIGSQARFSELQGKNDTYFCGAYLGNGFHEDGCRSGSQVASLLGVSW